MPAASQAKNYDADIANLKNKLAVLESQEKALEIRVDEIRTIVENNAKVVHNHTAILSQRKLKIITSIRYSGNR